MQVEGQQVEISVLMLATGARVSNAYATYLLQGDSFRKRKLIPHVITNRHLFVLKTTVVNDGHA